MILTVSLSVLCVILASLLVLSLYRMVQFIRFQDEVEIQLEDSLKILDRAYRDLTKATLTEVLQDDPVVRRAVASIKDSQKAVLLVINKLTTFDDNDEENNE